MTSSSSSGRPDITAKSERLIEIDFPLRQASIDSLHEKNIRHGHISTLHIWPARRPLAASRAAVAAALLPNPDDDTERRRLVQRLGGTIVQVSKRKRLPGGREDTKVADETVGGILHWGRESRSDIDWCRRAIADAYGRPPRVLDPFAGGGAIPLEAMRLGCEVTAGDINPVAWFLLKCTLEYQQQLAGERWPLPDFAMRSDAFMARFFQTTGRLTRNQLDRNLEAVQQALLPASDADVAWHFRAWAGWVLQRADADLERFYPVVSGQRPVGYLWARTARCKNCRATIPLLKTRWLMKTSSRRVLLTLEVAEDGIKLGVDSDVPIVGGNPAQRREHDRRVGAGTMTRSGARCPRCGGIMTMDDLRHEGRAKRFGTVMTAVAVEGRDNKEYRAPTEEELLAAEAAREELDTLFAEIPFGLPDEPLPSKDVPGVRVPLYGFERWSELFTPRQLLALGTFVKHIRSVRNEMKAAGYPAMWIEAISGFLALALDRLADRCSTLCQPDPSPTQSGVVHTFWRFALPMNWDFIEGVTTGQSSGGFEGSAEWIARVLDRSDDFIGCPKPMVVLQSATQHPASHFDLVVTDPPYYDAIPYADLMDFFYVWLRRTVYGLTAEIDDAFSAPLSPKWDHARSDGELIDDPSRFGGNRARSKQAYEDGMERAFRASDEMLVPDGHFVIVFAHKHPDAWEALVAAIIRAGFVVEASWPIQTEMGNRTRALSSAALSSSVWLVCRTRPVAARPGWDSRVVAEVQAALTARLRQFWDSGIRGPDFVWAATGPALTAYSRYPVVKKANAPGETLGVQEFLSMVRRFVVEFVVGRVLSNGGDAVTAEGVDNVTSYYLLHRNDFAMEDAPSGACILYAMSCALSGQKLVDQYDVLERTGGRAVSETEESGTAEEESGETQEGTGALLRLKPWSARRRKGLGLTADGRPVPLIDQVHHTMHLWRSGDVVQVNAYLDDAAVRSNPLFQTVLQALIELADAGSEERSILESISNHLDALGVKLEGQARLDLPVDTP